VPLGAKLKQSVWKLTGDAFRRAALAR